MTIPSSVRAVVTGAGSGIGRAFALQFARRRGAVLCSDIDLVKAEETAHLVEAAGATRAAAVRCDVARAEQVAELAEQADARIGGTDVIVNNAGVGVAGAVGDVPLDDWRWLMDINLWGVIYGCHVFVPRLKRQAQGHVINVASAAGIVSGPRMGPYNVAKAGVISLSETLSGELASSGVGVTVLCPTFIKTNILNASRGDDPGGKKVAQHLMDTAKLDADDVARITLEHADRDALYCLPQADAKLVWRLKRLDPTAFYKRLAPRMSKLMNDGQGKADWRAIARTLVGG
ncbi:MAG TPA: SDR family NAD(P)-dependent oxidoreductase [Byssovorax sp.]|jgi:NAD(P)-dependent dehydrogenase (short-subunit alcohol dehydrogenase family)